jgi:hypothetical protein
MKRISLLATTFMLIPRLTYSSALKTEAKCSSETSVDIQRILEDGTLPNHRFENLRSYILWSCSILQDPLMFLNVRVHVCMYSESASPAEKKLCMFMICIADIICSNFGRLIDYLHSIRYLTTSSDTT